MQYKTALLLGMQDNACFGVLCSFILFQQPKTYQISCLHPFKYSSEDSVALQIYSSIWKDILLDEKRKLYIGQQNMHLEHCLC